MSTPRLAALHTGAWERMQAQKERGREKGTLNNLNVYPCFYIHWIIHSIIHYAIPSVCALSHKKKGTVDKVQAFLCKVVSFQSAFLHQRWMQTSICTRMQALSVFFAVHRQTQKRVSIRVALIEITLHLHNISEWMDKHQALVLWLLHEIFVDQPHEVVPCLTLK